MTSALFVTTVPITLEAFLVPFAEHFRARGWRIDALSNGATSNPHIADSFDNRYDIGWTRNPLDLHNFVGSAARVREVVEQGAYDLVHVHTPIAAFVTRYALSDRSVQGRPQVIYTAHGFHFYRGGNPWANALYRSMERVAAPWTDFLVTINQEDFAAAKSFPQLDPDRVRFIPGIGVDIDRFDPSRTDAGAPARLREELEIEPDAFVLTMIAEFGAVKRHDHLFEALARVKDPRVVLLLVGTGPIEESLRRLASRLGIDSRIRWAGYRRDIPQILSASDAVTLVSEREGLPRSVLEAMAAGKPIIGTQTRGIADAVGTDAGWIVPKNDVGALAESIDQAVADPETTATKGRAARRRAVEEFGVTRIIEQYEELYREALSSRI